ncbi:MAG: DUF3040 domain-containing protein [Micrococcales bacterium]|nr:DUF3040 domain-containing protein [Micrococcales bacterium]
MPLSEYEQRVLDQLEEQLTSQDPRLGSKMSASSSARSGRVALGLAGVLAGLATLVVGMVVGLLWVSMAGFVIMFAGAYWALSRPKVAKGVKSSGTASGKSRPRRSKLSERFEKRWEDRGRE